MLIMSVLVALVLLVACANVANLLTAQAAARAREMALRVSIGAGRLRLVQLVLVESALLAIGASALGGLFASWSAPLVTSMLRVPGDPVRLVLDTGWRELAFSLGLALLVTLLFGLAPALRASAVQPIAAIKGTDDPRARRRLMRALLAAQIAFCALVLFVGGLFLNTFQRLANRPLGFSAERVLIMDTSANAEQPLATWQQVMDHLRQTPGVESVSLSGWPLLSGDRWTGSVRLPGHAVEPRPPYFLSVAPGFFETMRIRLIDGRDFRPGDLPPRLKTPAQPLPGVGIVNETFARTYFNGQNPVGRSVDVRKSKDLSAPMEIVGYVGDAVYRNLREPIPPTVYFPMGSQDSGAFLLRTAVDPHVLAPSLRREVSRARSDFRVRTIQTEEDFVRWHLVRERLLATLSLFFAVVALMLAAVGLYGVLNYSVMCQRREIGIRMALGARSTHVLHQVTTDVFAMICLGSAVGLAAGLASGRFIESLLFEVKATDLWMIAAPILTLAIVAVLAALPPALRASHIDPAQTLRSD
jgi:predicted permease